MPPAMPPPMAACAGAAVSLPRYGIRACARLGMVSVCSHTLPGPVRRAMKSPSPPKTRVHDALHKRDVEIDGRFEHADVTGMHLDRFVRLQIVGHDLAAEFDPGVAVPASFCSTKPLPPKIPAPSDC